MKIDLTFEYLITKEGIKFNNRIYPMPEFLRLVNLIDDYDKRDVEFRTVSKNSYGADYVYELKNYGNTVWIIAEVKMIRDLITYCDITKNSFAHITNFNNCIAHIFICGNFVIIIDSEKTRCGIWAVGELIRAGIPTSSNLVHIGPGNSDCGIELANNGKYPRLAGHSIGMGFTKNDYAEFLTVLLGYATRHVKEFLIG